MPDPTSVSNPPLARGAISFAGPRQTQDGWEISDRRGSSALTLIDLAPLAKIVVRAPVGGAVQRALGAGFGHTARAESSLQAELVIGSGPGEWLVLGPPDANGQLRARLTRVAEESGEFASVIDLTHGRALVRLRGEHAAALLAKLCAVDLSDAVIPDGAAFRSSVARVVTDVVRDDVAGTRSYLLHCERSSGQYLVDCLLDAGAEFGIEVDAFTR